MRTRKGSEQPIWLLVAVILALVIGAGLYQLISKSIGSQTFGNYFDSMDEDRATTTMNTLCINWMDDDWAVPLSDTNREALYRAEIRLGWILEAEYNAGNEPSTCDCATFLWKAGYADQREVLDATSDASKVITTISAAVALSRNANANIHRECHSRAKCHLDPTGPHGKIACAEIVS